MNIYEQRLREFQRLLLKEKLDAYVVNRTLEQGFLTGFALDGYMLLVARAHSWVFLPEMLLEHFRSQVGFCEAQSTENLLEDSVSRISASGFKKVGFDPGTETYQRGMFWKKKGLIEKPGLLACLRETKKGEEIGFLRKACRIAAKAIKITVPRIKPGRTERSVALELEHLMQKMGAKGPSFDTIIGSGPNSALPHHVTSDRIIKRNEPVLIDFGCVYKGYHSDITRTFFIGKPDACFKKVYGIVEKAQKAGLKKVKSGTFARAVDKACRDYIAGEGYGQHFIHGTGHGIGLEIHESPRLAVKSKSVLKSGMTVTVEPGIYLQGKFGVRIEDSVLVTKTGCEILTR
ncbi:MAG: aminopeptidase P family protein [bacterium]